MLERLRGLAGEPGTSEPDPLLISITQDLAVASEVAHRHALRDLDSERYLVLLGR